MKMRKSFLISVSVLALIALFPLTALACHIDNWGIALGCGGWTLSGTPNGADLRVVWKVWLYQDTDLNGSFETQVDYQFYSMVFDQGVPFLETGDWNVVCDGVYRAYMEAKAYYVGGGQAGAGATGEETGFTCQAPTAVTLAAFTASPSASGISLGWETASELNNLGFNVYRAEAADGPRAKLNADLIASQAPGGSAGASYEFVDASAQAGATYFYWLEALDVYGTSELHGPVSAALSPLSRLLPARPRPVAGPPALGSR